MPIYATAADYQTYIGEPFPDGKTFAIYQREAAEMVHDACHNDVFPVDEDGVPTHLQIKTAMQEATVIQIRAWIKADVDPEDSAATMAPGIVSSSASSASYSLGDASAQEAAKRALTERLTVKAWRRLKRAGLCSAVVSI